MNLFILEFFIQIKYSIINKKNKSHQGKSTNKKATLVCSLFKGIQKSPCSI